MEAFEFGKQVVMIAALTWAIVGALKGAVPLRPQQMALLVSAALAAVAWLSGYLQGNTFEVMASAILATLTASAAQRLAWSKGRTGGA